MAQNKNPKTNPDGSSFEPTIIKMGSTVARCQGVTRNGPQAGWQCTQAARQGYPVCQTHGAGTKKRVESGERREPRRAGARLGRIYRSHDVEGTLIADLARAIEQSGLDLDNTDPDLVHLRAVVHKMLLSEGVVSRALETIERGDKMAQDALEGLQGLPDIKTVMTVRKAAWDIQKAKLELSRYMGDLAQNLMRVSTFTKVRAEIKAKTAEAKMYEQFVSQTSVLKEILREMLDPQTYDAVYQRLKVEVYAKLPIEVRPVEHKA